MNQSRRVFSQYSFCTSSFHPSPGSRVPARSDSFQVQRGGRPVLLGFKHSQVLRGLLRGGAQASGSEQGQRRARRCTGEACCHHQQDQCKPSYWTEHTEKKERSLLVICQVSKKNKKKAVSVSLKSCCWFSVKTY